MGHKYTPLSDLLTPSLLLISIIGGEEFYESVTEKEVS